MHYVFVVLFLGTIVLSAIFQLMQIDLLRLYWRDISRRGSAPAPPPPLDVLPSVTIQLPMYNESAVAERILDKVAQIEYPRDRLQIQVLDDSTDHCTQILERKLAEMRANDPSLRIDYRHRLDRTGFKAGNLNEALPSVTGEFLALFDADFVPQPDFLIRLIPHFADEKIAVVQSRWGHLNAGDSYITRVQETFLDEIHSVEQRGRSASNLFLTFNGSAGIWRTQILRDLGGWNSVTTTEDIYISVAAQLRGFRIHFVEDYVTRGELPDSIVGLRLQMYRWFKGGAQSCLHYLGPVLAQPGSLHRRLHAALFLLAPFTIVTALVNVLLCGVLGPLLHWYPDAAALMPLAIIGAGWAPVLYCLYATARVRFDEGPLWRKLLMAIPRTLSVLGMTAGLSCQCTVAVIDAILGGQNQWTVTPKGFSTDAAGARPRSRARFPWYFWLDGLVLTYLIGALVAAIAFSAWFFALILSVWIGGYTWLFGGALIEVYGPATFRRPGRDATKTEVPPPLGCVDTATR